MSGSDPYKGGGTQAERRAFWAAFWEAEAVKSEIRLKRLQAIAMQVIPGVQNVDPPPIPSAGEVQKVASTGYVRNKLAELGVMAPPPGNFESMEDFIKRTAPPATPAQGTTPAGPVPTTPVPVPPPNGPHTYDRLAGMRPMSGTYTTDRTTKRWAAGEFPRKAMR